MVQLGADKMTNVMLSIAGRHISRWPRLAIAVVAAGSISAAPLRAAERYDADPALVAAAKKEGEIVWYTTLIVDQIVRPLIRAFRSQVAAIDIKYIRADSLALAVKLINEGRAGRIEADIWHLTDGARALVEAGVVAEFDLPGAKAWQRPSSTRANAGLRRTCPGDHSRTTPIWYPRVRHRAAFRICSIPVGRESLHGIRIPWPGPGASSERF